MRIVLAGVGGALGSRLAPELMRRGHEVVGITRYPQNVAAIEALGARGVVADVLEHDGLRSAIVEADPDLVMHEVTGLPKVRATVPIRTRAVARVRTVGTENLVSAAAAAQARFMAQSVAFPLQRSVQRAVTYLEDRAREVDGLVVRYGHFYGPGTWFPQRSKDDESVQIETAARLTADLVDEPGGIVTVLDSGITRLQ